MNEESGYMLEDRDVFLKLDMGLKSFGFGKINLEDENIYVTVQFMQILSFAQVMKDWKCALLSFWFALINLFLTCPVFQSSQFHLPVLSSWSALPDNCAISFIKFYGRESLLLPLVYVVKFHLDLCFWFPSTVALNSKQIHRIWPSFLRNSASNSQISMCISSTDIYQTTNAVTRKQMRTSSFQELQMCPLFSVISPDESDKYFSQKYMYIWKGSNQTVI